VPPQIRERILENGLRAPSGGFTQGWAFLTLEGQDRDRYWAIAAETVDEKYVEWVTGLRRAPLLIFAFAHKDAYLDRYTAPDKGRTERDESRWAAPYWYIDTGMAALLMLQTVVDEGLGACLFGPPADKVDRLKKEFAVPAEFDPVGVISVGFRAPDRRSPSLKRGRRSTAEVVHRGQWGHHAQ
jgi:nitroreductase